MPPIAMPKSSTSIGAWPRIVTRDFIVHEMSRRSLTVASIADETTAAESAALMNFSSPISTFHVVFGAPVTPRTSRWSGNVGARFVSSTTTALWRSPTSGPSDFAASPTLKLCCSLA